MMARNLGSFDRAVRLLLGAVIIFWGIYSRTWWGMVGLIPILTAVVGRCGLYVPFGISTCREKVTEKVLDRR